MGALEDLALAISGQDVQQQVAAENPYYRFQGIPDAVGGIAQRAAGSGKYGIGETALVGGLSGLLSGVLGGAGDRYQNTLTDRYRGAIFSSLAGNDSKPEGLPDSLFNIAKNRASLFAAQRALQNADQDAAYGRERDLALTKAIIQNPDAADSILGAVARAEGRSPPSPLKAETPSIDEIQPEDRFGIGETLQEKKQRLIKEGRRMGMTGNAAMEYASSLTKVDDIANKEAQKKIDEARAKAAQLAELANTAEAGVAGAGVTGGAGWGVRNALSKVYATVSPEEEKQRTAQGVLDSIAPELVKMNRSPGAVTDYETKLYLGSGPSSQNTPEVNAVLVDKIKNIAALEEERANFIEDFVTRYGSAREAEKYWNQYKKANPIFIKDPETGEYVINQNRTPIQEFDFAQAASGVKRKGSSGSWADKPIVKGPDGNEYVFVD